MDDKTQNLIYSPWESKSVNSNSIISIALYIGNQLLTYKKFIKVDDYWTLNNCKMWVKCIYWVINKTKKLL